MSFDFPSPASEGTFFAPPGGPQYVMTNGAWRMLGAVNVSISNIVQTVVTSSGTYTKPAGLKFLEVTCVGGGGGATGCATTAAGQSAAGGGGGGSATAIKLYPASGLAATEAYTIGAGGGSPGGSGAAGGSSTFKGLTAAGGGAPDAVGASGAVAGTTTVGSLSGVGGTASGGDLNIDGGTGAIGLRAPFAATNAWSGVGGTSWLTTPNQQLNWLHATFVNAVTGRFPGGGASGASVGPSRTGLGGAIGGTGCIILKEFF